MSVIFSVCTLRPVTLLLEFWRESLLLLYFILCAVEHYFVGYVACWNVPWHGLMHIINRAAMGRAWFLLYTGFIIIIFFLYFFCR